MKILHLITGLNYGGAESMLLGVVQHLQKQGIQQDVISLSTNGAIGERLQNLGIKVSALHLPRGRMTVKGWRTLRRLVKESQPDLMQTWLYHADFAGALLRLSGIRCPLVWGVHHSADNWREMKATTRLVLCANRLLARWLPDAIVCCSESASQSHAALGYPAKKMVIIPNGIDTQRFQPHDQGGERLRNRLGVPAGSLMVGHCGRWIPLKGHRIYVEMAARLRAGFADMHFVMCGEGIDVDNDPLMAWIEENGLSGNVHLMGGQAAMEEIYQGLDLFVSSSLSEAMPLTVMEAMACGVPCVVTDVGDQGTLVAEWGVVVMPGSADALIHGCEQVLGLTCEEQERLGQGARQRIVNDYSLDAAAQKYLTVYQRLLAE
ncbi:MAG TPA: glycosyltransferase [Chloroflexi bacterium]|nr:glycosyltransferase [Chloroflexota bacterium]